MFHVSKDCRKSLPTGINVKYPKVSSEDSPSAVEMTGAEQSDTTLKAPANDTGNAQRKQTSVTLLLELRDLLMRCSSQETVTEANQSLEKIKQTVQNRNCFRKRRKHRQMPTAAKKFLKSKEQKKYLLNRKKSMMRKFCIKSIDSMINTISTN